MSSAFDMRLMQKVLVLSVPFVYIIKHVIFSVGFIWIVEEQSLCGSILNKTLSQLGHFSSADENKHRNLSCELFRQCLCISMYFFFFFVAMENLSFQQETVFGKTQALLYWVVYCFSGFL